MVKAFTNTAITAKGFKSTASAVNLCLHWAYSLTEQELISFHAERVSLWGFYGCSKLVNGPFVSSCVPALPCLISATWNILCPVWRCLWGKKRKLIFFTQKFPAGFSGTEGQGMRILHMEDVGNQADSAGSTGTEQGSLGAAQLDWLRVSLAEPHPPAQGSQDCSRVTAATRDVNHLWAKSWQGFMHRQIIFCLPLFLIMTAFHLLGWYCGIPGTSRGASYCRGGWGTWQLNSGSFCLGNTGKSGNGSWSLL